MFRSLRLVFVDGTKVVVDRMNLHIPGVGCCLPEEHIIRALEEGKTFMIEDGGGNRYVNSNTIREIVLLKEDVGNDTLPNPRSLYYGQN